MSARPVREAFRAAWTLFSPALPYADGINSHPGTLPARFGTLVFQAESRRDVTMGTDPWVIEEGTVTVAFFTEAGEGDSDAIDLATAAAVWFGGRQLAPDLRVTGISGPNDPAEEGEGAFFEVQVSVNYEWQGREARAS